MDIFQKCFSFTRAKEARAAGFYPYFNAIQSGAGPEVTVNGRRMIMVGSNNYLGLTQHPRVKEAAIKAVEKYGSGCTGSRFLNGNLDIHDELEKRLAKFLGKEAALIFSTGFQTNQGIISTIVGKDDIVFADRADHASIVDGCRLSFGKAIKYKHNDMADLEETIKNCRDGAGMLVVSDGVFSMEGDIVELPKMAQLKKKYGFRILIDDAHALGVIGEGGRGTGSHFGLNDEVDLIMGTFSKSFASLGGVVAGDFDVIDYIKHHARALIFSASMPPAAVAAVIAALDIIESEPQRIARLWEITRKMHNGYSELGFDIGGTQTPIIPVMTGEESSTFGFWKSLFEAGIYANPVIPPASPPDRGGLMRTSYMATHTEEQLDRVLETFATLGRKFGIIGK